MKLVDIEEQFTPQRPETWATSQNPLRWHDYEPIPAPSDPAMLKRYKETWYQVNEQFSSIQGEGKMTGVSSTFIRLQGCPVGCSWCDSGPLADLVEGRMTNGETRNTWGKGGQRRTLLEILTAVRTRHVVITGGEPTIWNLDPLIQALWDIGCTVQMETSGYTALKGELVPDWVTWSPKINLDYICADTLIPHVKEVKWVVDELLEWDTVWSWWQYFQSRQQPVFSLMPEGSPPNPAMVAKALLWLEYVPMKHQRDWMYSHRLQYVLQVR